MTRRYKLPLLAAFTLICAFSGCIKNDIPYARIPQSILSLKAVGESRTAAIDDENLQATVYLDETVDIENVSFSEFTYTDGATTSIDLLSGKYNLSRPMSLVLSRYQNYVWTISAVQEIERYFTVDGQVGATTIDVPGRRVVLKISDKENLANLTLTSIKLGPEGLTTMVPGLKPGKINLSRPLEVDVTAFGRTERWTIYAEKTSFVVNTTAVDAWSQVIWAYGESQEGVSQGFQYRRSDQADWIDVPQSDIVSEGGVFSTCIPHLEPLTEYVVRAVSGENIGTAITVTTQDTRELPNASFDEWWLDGNVWCPWPADGQRFWDTGNRGAATLGDSNVTPSDYTPDNVGKSACLLTAYRVVKLAAGSIYAGSFARISGTNGVLDFGREWNLRPTKLKGYFQYTAKNIDKSDADHKYLVGRPDSCHIYVALTDWTAPFEIRTSPSDLNLFDCNSSSVIGYGELIFSGEMDSYKEFEIKINYRSTSRVPTYLLITSAASKYGDFFTGGVGSLLYVDKFSLEYDY